MNAVKQAVSRYEQKSTHMAGSLELFIFLILAGAIIFAHETEWVVTLTRWMCLLHPFSILANLWIDVAVSDSALENRTPFKVIQVLRGLSFSGLGIVLFMNGLPQLAVIGTIVAVLLMLWGITLIVLFAKSLFAPRAEKRAAKKAQMLDSFRDKLSSY